MTWPNFRELGFFIGGSFSGLHPVFLFKIVSSGPRESVADTLFAASIRCSSSAPEQ
jgi:hypothetical protein